MKNIVFLGGGTGLSTVLKGFKKSPYNISAIVSVIDDGASSGILREDFNMIPPGDIRQCLISLSSSPKELKTLLEFRFKDKLNNHSFGNLLLTALMQIKGNFKEGLETASKILKLNGKIIPVSYDNIKLKAIFEDETEIIGEHKIPDINKKIVGLELVPKNPKVNEEAIKVLKEANLIVFSPGSLFTSIIPILLKTEIINTLKEVKAKKLYICNLLTQKGETENFTVSEHISNIYKFSYPEILDYLIINNSLKISNKLNKKLKSEDKSLVKIDNKIDNNLKVFTLNLLSIKNNIIKHDYKKVRKIIDLIIEKENI